MLGCLCCDKISLEVNFRAQKLRVVDYVGHARAELQKKCSMCGKEVSSSK